MSATYTPDIRIHPLNESLKTGIISIDTLLQYSNIVIPIYQRPYKWTLRNVTQLLDDILTFHNKPSYRIGTLVIHDDGEHWNIVDGQQRTITCMLVAKAIITHKLEAIQSTSLKALIDSIDAKMVKPKFTSEISFKNIQNNYREIERRVKNFDESIIDFFFYKCELTQFVLTNISEAFQFFDSQNARGKDLEPHDLLKAFHLREFTANDKAYELQVVEKWEETDTEELRNLFSDFLYRVKGWAKGNSSRYFSKDDTFMFKGINLGKIENYPFIEVLKMADVHVSENETLQNLSSAREFPFQLDQTIINGKRFFQMISHYKLIYENFKQKKSSLESSYSNTAEIMNCIDNYEGRNRTGDKYVRMLFDCALLYYIDKFGYREIQNALPKIFVWAYSLRLTYQNIQMASVDNYVVGAFNIFRIIKDAVSPIEIISIELPFIKETKSTKTTDLEILFKQMNYHD